MNVEHAIEAAERLLPGTAAPDQESDPRWQALIFFSDLNAFAYVAADTAQFTWR